MSELSIDGAISKRDIAKRKSSHLSSDDPNKASCVSKTWQKTIQESDACDKITLTLELMKDVKTKRLKNYIEENHKNTSDVEVLGWSKGKLLPGDVYDNLFRSSLRESAKRLSLKGRGIWDSCYCPEEGSKCGEQYDTIENVDITNLEYIYVGTTFTISSCALLDLISRSPKLKILRFYGIICNHNHYEIFKSKRFLSDLEQVYWPFPKKKKQVPTLSTIIKRNENVLTLYSNADATCDLLSADALRNLRYLSINLNENWMCKPKIPKRAREHLEKIKYLSLAKNVEALEVRTFQDHEYFSECSDTNLTVSHLYENYKLTFWTQVAKLQKLKYLGVYGAWELEETCREMVKHGLQVEYLKINLIPNAIIASIDKGDDNPILAMPDGARDLRKLPRLRSLHFICYEKLASIDARTTTALKELMDLFWIVDIKSGFTDEVEDLLCSIMKRGNQLGKMFKVQLLIQPKDEELASILVKTTLRFPTGTPLQTRLLAIADSELSKRQIKGSCEKLFIWGIEQVDSCREKEKYRRLSESWQLYEDKFRLSSWLA